MVPFELIDLNSINERDLLCCFLLLKKKLRSLSNLLQCFPESLHCQCQNVCSLFILGLPHWITWILAFRCIVSNFTSKKCLSYEFEKIRSYNSACCKCGQRGNVPLTQQILNTLHLCALLRHETKRSCLVFTLGRMSSIDVYVQRWKSHFNI